MPSVCVREIEREGTQLCWRQCFAPLSPTQRTEGDVATSHRRNIATLPAACQCQALPRPTSRRLRACNLPQFRVLIWRWAQLKLRPPIRVATARLQLLPAGPQLPQVGVSSACNTLKVQRLQQLQTNLPQPQPYRCLRLRLRRVQSCCSCNGLSIINRCQVAFALWRRR